MTPEPMRREDWLDTRAGEIHDGVYLGAERFLVDAAPYSPPPEETKTNRELSPKRMFAAWYITCRISGMSPADMLNTTNTELRVVPEQPGTQFYDPYQDHELFMFIQEASIFASDLSAADNDWRLAIAPLIDRRTAQAAWPTLVEMAQWEMNDLLEPVRRILAFGGTPFTVLQKFCQKFEIPGMMVKRLLGGVVQYLAETSSWDPAMGRLLAQLGAAEVVSQSYELGDLRGAIVAQKQQANILGLIDTKDEKNRKQIEKGFQNVLGIISEHGDRSTLRAPKPPKPPRIP
jgi:hypothetical protein